MTTPPATPNAYDACERFVTREWFPQSLGDVTKFFRFSYTREELEVALAALVEDGVLQKYPNPSRKDTVVYSPINRPRISA